MGLLPSMLPTGFIKTNLFKSHTAVGLRDDSPYNQFSHVSHWDDRIPAQGRAAGMLACRPPGLCAAVY
jgi:hypothetical protein